MTFIYTPPEPAMRMPFGQYEFSIRDNRAIPLFTESQLHSEVERVRRDTVEACAKHFDAMPGREMFGDAIADEIRELLK